VSGPRIDRIIRMRPPLCKDDYPPLAGA